jgi:hypothetical protein
MLTIPSNVGFVCGARGEELGCCIGLQTLGVLQWCCTHAVRCTPTPHPHHAPDALSCLFRRSCFLPSQAEYICGGGDGDGGGASGVGAPAPAREAGADANGPLGPVLPGPVHRLRTIRARELTLVGGALLGEGAFGQVQVGVWNGTDVAIKANGVDRRDPTAIDREREMWALCPGKAWEGGVARGLRVKLVTRWGGRCVCLGGGVRVVCVRMEHGRWRYGMFSQGVCGQQSPTAPLCSKCCEVVCCLVPSVLL